MITTALRFIGKAGEKCRDGGGRIGLRLKADQLRMMPVALGRTGEDFLGQQRLPPGGHQSFRVQISRMHGP